MSDPLTVEAIGGAGMNDEQAKINSIRAELAAAVNDAFAADPEALDAPTLELLKSGILTPDEYERLMNKAAADGNTTMMRVIGSYAEKEAEAVAEKNGVHDNTARALRAVAYQAKNTGSGVYLQNFDVLAEALNRSVRNPGLWSKWEELTGEVIARGF